MNAKEYLQQIRMINKSISILDAEIEELRTEASSIRSPNSDDVRVDLSGSGDRIANLVEKIIATEKRREDDRAYKQRIRTMIFDDITKINNVDYQELLYKRYAEEKTWEQIAVEMDYSWRYVLKLHGRALVEIQKILDNTKRT